MGKPPAGAMELAPRRVRAMVGGVVVFDTTRARYYWEWPHYPQYYIPVDDVTPGLLADGAGGDGGDGEVRLDRGPARRMDLRVGEVVRRSAALLHTEEPLAGLVRFEWEALDAWFEEDEEVFVHPRDPYSRVDALRSTRHVRIELDGVRLAESSSPVLLFETGLPTRYYLNRTEVDLGVLEPSATTTACPYKGRTTAYWSVRTPKATYPDLAWSYSFPTAGLAAIAGLICFYNEKVDIHLDGRPLERPITPFSS